MPRRLLPRINEQTTENQIREIEAAGFHVEKRRLVAETVSGSSAIEPRPGFMELLDRLERDDVLVVTKRFCQKSRQQV
jgi:putative DNA-invertase from lambdoid prophage Rac